MRSLAHELLKRDNTIIKQSRQIFKWTLAIGVKMDFYSQKYVHSVRVTDFIQKGCSAKVAIIPLSGSAGMGQQLIQFQTESETKREREREDHPVLKRE